ncbi:MAG: MbcA/ParS/Xre antitoxin family protein [Alphaproteobacteria bacterium]
MEARTVTTDVDVAAVGFKAYGRITDYWGLANDQAAELIDTAPRTYARGKAGGALKSITKDQTLRLSAIVGIYKALGLLFDDALASAWVSRPNTGPLFHGARPIDVMIDGGLPKILKVRNYLDALRGGV